MSDSQLHQQRLLLHLYQSLKSIENSLERIEKHSLTFLSIKDSVDLNHADTYLEITEPITLELNSMKLTILNTKWELKDYQQLQSPSSSIEPKPPDSSIETIEIITIRQETNCWSCQINTPGPIQPILVQADSKASAIVLGLRELATQIETLAHS